MYHTHDVNMNGSAKAFITVQIDGDRDALILNQSLHEVFGSYSVFLLYLHF